MGNNVEMITIPVETLIGFLFHLSEGDQITVPNHVPIQSEDGNYVLKIREKRVDRA